MSLIESMMDECIFLNKQRVDDGYGGYKTTWTDGASFQAAVTFDSSLQAQVASKEGVTSLYTVTMKKAVTLDYHDAFRRVRDGKVFRVTSDGDDKYSPSVSTLDIRQVTAEEWTIDG